MLGKTDASFLKNTRPLYSVRKRRVRSITTSKRSATFREEATNGLIITVIFLIQRGESFFLRQFCVKNGWSACVDRSLSATNLNFFVTYIGRCVSHVSLLFIPGNHIFTICLPGLSLGSTSTLRSSLMLELTQFIWIYEQCVNTRRFEYKSVVWNECKI